MNEIVRKILMTKYKCPKCKGVMLKRIPRYATCEDCGFQNSLNKLK